MSAYIHDNYLLTNPLAERLYHEAAALMPIIDFHNHLDPQVFIKNKGPQNLTQAWLMEDHYVWRAMRSNGIDERFITGDASEEEKFKHWCEAMPYLLGNPLYHWAHLELARFFDCQLLLNPQNCAHIWQLSQEKLQSAQALPRQIMQKLNLEIACTTDSPLQSLETHQQLAQLYQNKTISFQVLPSFRADDLFNFDSPDNFASKLSQLTSLTQIKIACLDDYLAAIYQRMATFAALGCKSADLGLPQVPYQALDQRKASQAFICLLNQKRLNEDAAHYLFSYVFHYFGRHCETLDWALQLHVGVRTNVNQRRLSELGAGTGFSVIGEEETIEPLANLLSDLDASGQMPKLILFNLNPSHNAAFVALCGAFQDSGSAKGKVQYGPAWWFNDHKQGISAQLTNLKNLGALGRFIGMTTDSRNLFSLSRHEYFRRILSEQFSQWARCGDLPNDWDLLSSSIKNICYHNAKEFFTFNF